MSSWKENLFCFFFFLTHQKWTLLFPKRAINKQPNFQLPERGSLSGQVQPWMLILFYWKHLGFKDVFSGLACTRAVLSPTQASERPNSVTLGEQIIRRKLVDRDKKACVEGKRKSQEKYQGYVSLGLYSFAMRYQPLLWTGHIQAILSLGLNASVWLEVPEGLCQRRYLWAY